MHVNSLDIMRYFRGKYVPDKPLKVLDIGSRVVKKQGYLGTYKQFFLDKEYLGVDVSAGENVDLVVGDYILPFPDETFDIIVSGQTIEHMKFPWVWFVEMARVLKNGGLCCIIAPAVIHEHRHPIDTYRYYPDGMEALAEWAKLTVIETKRMETEERKVHLEDTYLVARKM